jgi:epsin
MAEIARATRTRDELALVMKQLWSRLDHRDEEWRHVYKALTVMEFLVAQGAVTPPNAHSQPYTP